MIRLARTLWQWFVHEWNREDQFGGMGGGGSFGPRRDGNGAGRRHQKMTN